MTPDEPRRFFAFFLHGHLPWVLSHGRWPHGAEWLCEATIETYLPLVAAARRWRARRRRGGITLGVSPVLAEQLAHPRFAELLDHYLEDRTHTAGDEILRHAREGRSDISELAKQWQGFYRDTRRLFFDELQGDLLGALRDLESSGTIEIATCAATHAYLPLVGRDESIALQIELARRVHERHFGRPPSGIWIPEAAYRPEGLWTSPTDPSRSRPRVGVEAFLARAGLHWFLVDASLLVGGRSIGSYPDLFDRHPEVRHRARSESDPIPAPSRARDPRHSYWVAGGPGSEPGVRFFVRDPDTALQVWSGDHGYPGDPAYLEFHKRSDGGGHHYWRVTGPGVDLGDKQVYDPAAARERVRSHADHFGDLVGGALEGARDGAILAAPFDAELFGHWWREGIDWLGRVLERFHEQGRPIPTTFGRHAEDFPPEEIVRLPEGSWGEGGMHWVWLNDQVNWMWKLIHPAEDETWDLWRRVEREGSDEARRIARAAGRQLVLLMASDWPFLVTTGSAADYATSRVRLHADDLARLVRLGRASLDGAALSDDDRRFVAEVEKRDDLFPEIAEAMSAAVRTADALGAAGGGVTA